VESGFGRVVHQRAASGLGRAVIDGLLAVLLAPACLACGTPLPSPSRGPVCADCWLSIRPLSPPLCPRCGDPVLQLPRADGAEPGTTCCPRCLHQPSPITIGRSAGAYEGALRSIVRALKYEGRRGLAAPLASLMRERGAEVLRGADLVVPVPLHWRRQLVRGFNQAEDLAWALGLPVCRALARTRATRPQFGLRPGARQRNVAGAFAPRRGLVSRRRVTGRLEDACVVVVDDLATTGATLRACGSVLMGMGAREVRSLTAARALTRLP
jgi:ComF family protein